MNTSLKADEFYVHHPTKGEYFSIAGLQFMSELISQAVQANGWDPTKVSFGLDGDSSVWIGYPSASTKIVTSVRVKDGHILYCPRVPAKGQYRWSTMQLPLADPNLAKNLGDALIHNLPKNSKFYDRSTETH